ncbi:protein phosphatase 1K, putative [Entamoeba invadens IP1]|uniref:Protein phosphatase 1K, putative n=1 Tax=Entamoeba invadens IP1 TaxID=370355 RepID=A0A0A1U323_ENTIV|nr:protein phosphatase 1K, putative [Entamoeba invadens IP1]ELP88424.1 protein phosphatase 1K, putative [Entamoeba invadens IP1]|eukprot:XP_004255195.1 protein phosphatase 1K, putative [Entamoeba invadens IP1]
MATITLQTTCPQEQTHDKPTNPIKRRVRSADTRKKSFYAQDRPVFIDNRTMSGNIVLPKLSSAYSIKKGGPMERIQSGQSFDDDDTDPLLHNVSFKPGRFSSGASQTVGKRVAMEDTLMISGALFEGIDYYGVFDGHNGDGAAISSMSVCHTLIDEKEIKGAGCSEHMKNVFSELHRRICETSESGTTASVVIVRESDCIISLIGDSPVYVLFEGKLKRIGKDHNPEDPEEYKRVIESGGRIADFDGLLRVNEQIAVTRSIGDKALHPPLTCIPDTFILPLNQIQRILIATDGISVLQESAIQQLMSDSVSPGETARVIRNVAFDKESKDNISVIVIDLTQ